MREKVAQSKALTAQVREKVAQSKALTAQVREKVARSKALSAQVGEIPQVEKKTALEDSPQTTLKSNSFYIL
ncbi:hypothetical protein [Lysinibacillus sp. UBA6686]|uniref:hypothetical protein n=1 Tax=Lysinibacillus sp. UBA6686 TaxID=1946776 RepID=UPI00257AD9B3|nr:hypothetical protein [Lysinibacillus sp. UBA6686]